MGPSKIDCLNEGRRHLEIFRSRTVEANGSIWRAFDLEPRPSYITSREDLPDELCSPWSVFGRLENDVMDCFEQDVRKIFGSAQLLRLDVGVAGDKDTLAKAGSYIFDKDYYCSAPWTRTVKVRINDFLRRPMRRSSSPGGTRWLASKTELERRFAHRPEVDWT